MDSSSSGLALTMSGTTFLSPGVGGTGYALNTAAAASNYGNVAKATGASSIFANLKSYTITGWYNAAATNPSGRILAIGNTSSGDFLQLYFGSSSGNSALALQAGTTGTSLALVNSSATSQFNSAGSWVFFAVTVDTTVSNLNSGVKFYVGSTSASASQVANASGAQGSLAGYVTPTDLDVIALANSFNSGTSANNRALVNASLDNIQIYGSTTDASGALDLSTLQGIQVAAIPEAKLSDLLLLSGGILVACRLVNKSAARVEAK